MNKLQTLLTAAEISSLPIVAVVVAPLVDELVVELKKTRSTSLDRNEYHNFPNELRSKKLKPIHIINKTLPYQNLKIKNDFDLYDWNVQESPRQYRKNRENASKTISSTSLDTLLSRMETYIINFDKEKYKRLINIQLSCFENFEKHNFSITLKASNAKFYETARQTQYLNPELTSLTFSASATVEKAPSDAKYEIVWNKWIQSVLQRRESITIWSDTGGDLSYVEQNIEYKDNVKSNIDYLNEYISYLNTKAQTIIDENFLKISFKIVDAKNNRINLYLNFPNERKYLLASNIKINYKQTSKYDLKKLPDKLIIKTGKWVDFETNTTALVDDVLVPDPKDKKPKKLTGKEWWGGRWIAHTPLSLSFTASLDETEVLLINGKRIDVLDQTFETDLVDKRRTPNDEDTQLNYGISSDEDIEHNEENSHKKNEYKIEIIKYKTPGNLEIEFRYTKVIVIDSRSSASNFKWYAWDPANNPNQQILIEPYLKDEKGNNVVDKNGAYVLNPKYDPAIDKQTGTKKQLVWFSFSDMKNAGRTLFDAEDKKTTKNNSFARYYSDAKKVDYYSKSLLPYNSKTLFTPHNDREKLDAGVIMEASVLGKGALMSLMGNNENFTLFKLNESGYFTKIDDKYYKQLITKTGESSYFSSSGIWLFASNTEKSISNYKLVLIKEESDPQSYFTDNISIPEHIAPLFQTNQGKKFYHFLTKKGLSAEDIYSLNYEDAMEYYKLYINALYNNAKYSNHIVITPKFKKIADNTYSTEEFQNKYFNNHKLFETDLVDNFENKDLVAVSNISFNEEKTGIYVSFSLRTHENIYSLSSNKYFIPIKFRDVEAQAKQIINLNINKKYFLDLAKNTYINEFVEAIDRKQIFDLNDEDFAKIDITLIFSPTEKTLNIRVKLLDEFVKNYVLQPQTSWTFFLDKFKTDDKSVVDIFKNLKLTEINLSGIDELEAAKNLVKNKVEEALPNLTINEDYVIKNLETTVKERLIPQSGINEFNPPFFSNLILEALKDKIGYRKIRIINTVDKLITKDYDLSLKKLPDTEINENKLSKIKKKVVEIVNKNFEDEEFEVDKDIIITNFSEGISALTRSNNTYTFIIKGSNYKIKNQTTINIKNVASRVIDDTNNNDPEDNPIDKNDDESFNLKNLKLNNLSFKEYVASVLKNRIITEITSNLSKIYKLEKDLDYYINDNELNELVKNLIKKSDVALSRKLIIRSISPKTKNSSSITISNFNKFYEPSDDLEENDKTALKKTLMLIFIPIGMVGLIIISLIIWLIYVRKIKNKVS
ncbi:hypothetical protein DIE66_00590 [Mycoplasmopsis arginini]|uniref:Mbov_0399 family ICE element protein n=1 Tax=Mycoplasmopsis arginini TaxID=2094 RepID=UPI000D604511|nr:hypothetical protein [Mycoplasmopsis arginini]PWC09122.1 hypothetical protein DIE66_00590 [Mycoplasmopsis arginini]